MSIEIRAIDDIKVGLHFPQHYPAVNILHALIIFLPALIKMVGLLRPLGFTTDSWLPADAWSG